LACSTLLWLVGVIKHCDRKLFETMLKEFLKYTDLHNSRTTHIVNNYYSKHEILNILINWFLKVRDGEMIGQFGYQL
jgi:hypothetical protein